jgi:hypothetical protein
MFEGLLNAYQINTLLGGNGPEAPILSIGFGVVQFLRLAVPINKPHHFSHEITFFKPLLESSIKDAQWVNNTNHFLRN